MTINIYAGKHWNMSPDYLYGERAMIERQQPRLDSLRIDELKLSPGNPTAEQALTKVKVLLGGDFNPSTTRVHAWAFNLFPYDIESNLAKRLSLKSEDATLYRSAVYLFK